MISSSQLKRYGGRGILLSELSDAELAGIREFVRQRPPVPLVEHVEGYDSILLIFSELPEIELLRDQIETFVAEFAVTSNSESARLHEIEVSYDGLDLEDFATAVKLPEDEVVEIHSKSIYTVRFMGFSPGFPYLEGLDPRLHLPRKSSPRPRIEAGSVAIGGTHAGIYSIDSPGGWHIIGRTAAKLFNPDAASSECPNAAEVFLLQPGDRVCFKPR